MANTSFSVKQIKAILSEYGVPVEKLDDAAQELCSRHNTALDAIKEERDNYKTVAETVDAVQKELDDLKAQKDDGYKDKYEKEHQDFEKYKSDVKSKETATKIRSAYKKLLEDQNIHKDDIEMIMRGVKFDGMKLDGDNLADSENLVNTIKTEYARYIPKFDEHGAPVQTPPHNDDGKPGANARAAELAKKYHERRYGKAPEQKQRGDA